MKNGYALATSEGLREISTHLRECSEEDLNQLRSKLKVGIQWSTQVTLDECSHLVSQVYCSGLPVAYSHHTASLWSNLAKLVLESAYEATLSAGVINALRTGNRTVFLTMLGGGAFGNETDWIIGAIDSALKIHAHSGLDVRMVSFGSPNDALTPLLQKFS